MKINSIEELKAFLLWARKEQIEEVKVDENGISARFTQLAFVPGLSPTAEPDPESPNYQPNSKTWTDVDQSQESEEDLLMWSTNS